MEYIIAFLAVIIAFAARRQIRELTERVANLEARLGVTPPPVPNRPVSPFAPRPALDNQTPLEPGEIARTPLVPRPIREAPAATAEPVLRTPADDTAPLPVAPSPPVEELASTRIPPSDDVPAAEAPTPSPPPPAPEKPPQPAQPKRGFEESFGTRWVVWVGGLALALGGVFLVQYSIEAGLLGPAVRIALGALFALVLAAAGEWSRRKQTRLGLGGIPSANIPSILTAAGVVVGFADIYAGYAIHDFFGPTLAFALLGVVSMAALLASLVHGPWLAALGLLGAYVTPILIASNTPNYWALYVYLAAVTAATFVLASARTWQWLAIAALTLSVLWFFPGLGDFRVDSLTPHAFHVLAGFVLAAAFLVSGLLLGPPSPGRLEKLSSASVGAYVALAAVLVFAREHDGLAIWTFGILALATVAIAWRAVSALGAVALVALLVAPVTIDWTLFFAALPAPIVQTGLVQALFSASENFGDAYLPLGVAIAAVTAVAGYWIQGRHQRVHEPVVWAAAAAYAPISMLVGAYLRLGSNARSLPLAAIAIGLGAIFALATETLTRRETRPGVLSAAAIFASGSVAALALALTFVLEGGSLTVGLALMAVGVAWVTTKRPLPMLRWLVGVLAVLVTARTGIDPQFAVGEIGTTPIFNGLIYFYGVPALAFWVGGLLLRRRGDDVPSRSVESGAILFTAVFAFLEVRHYVQGGDLAAPSTSLVEIALQAATGLAMAIGLEWTRARSASVIRDIGAQIIAFMAFAAIMIGLILLHNPLFTGEAVGGPVVNKLLLAYGLPAALAAILARVTRETRPHAFVEGARDFANFLAVIYLTLETRRFFHGPVLSRVDIFDVELFTYPVLWLGLAIGFEALSRRMRERVYGAEVVVLAAAAMSVTALGALVLRNPLLQPISVGGPIINLLFLAYAVPAMLVAVLIRVARDSRPQQFKELGRIVAIALGVVYLTLETRRFFHGPVLSARGVLDAELYTYPVLWLILAIGFEELLKRTRDRIDGLAVLGLAGMAVAVVAFGSAVARNPLLVPVSVGGPIVNLLFLAYVVPALLLAVLGMVAAETRPIWFRRAGAAIVPLGLLYLTLEVRRFFHGPVIIRQIGFFDAERYTFSAIWLAYGVVLFACGLTIRSQLIRLASAAVIVLTIGKVFLFDLAVLTGLFRVLSFIGLGIVLVGIGVLYQRLLFPSRPAAAAEPPIAPQQ